MHIPSPRPNKRPRIEIIPLIDIIFFLLATFVMVSLSMIKNRGIPVNLPASVTSTQQERKEYLAITLTKHGEILFNQEKTSIQDLPGRLRTHLAGNSDPKVFLNGDEMALLGHAVAVLDEVRKAGISKVAIETKPKE